MSSCNNMNEGTSLVKSMNDAKREPQQSRLLQMVLTRNKTIRVYVMSYLTVLNYLAFVFTLLASSCKETLN